MQLARHVPLPTTCILLHSSHAQCNSCDTCRRLPGRWTRYGGSCVCACVCACVCVYVQLYICMAIYTRIYTFSLSLSLSLSLTHTHTHTHTHTKHTHTHTHMQVLTSGDQPRDAPQTTQTPLSPEDHEDKHRRRRENTFYRRENTFYHREHRRLASAHAKNSTSSTPLLSSQPPTNSHPMVTDTEGAAWERDREREREIESGDSERYRYMSKTLPLDATLPEIETMPDRTTKFLCKQ